MDNVFGLRGSRVLVAGAGGLGQAIVGAFVEQGSRVVVIDRSEEALARLDAAVGLTASDGAVLQVDMSEAQLCRDSVAEATSVLGGIDVFVHAVGINIRKPMLDITDDEWLAVLTSNLFSAYWLGQAIGAQMCERGSGRQVYLSSVSAMLAHEHHGPYAASKGGMNQLIRVMAREWAASGVGVNAIAPGYIETSLTAGYLSKPGMRESLESLVPAGRLGRPEDLSGAILFLASPLASFITGQVLYIDGGRTLV